MTSVLTSFCIPVFAAETNHLNISASERHQTALTKAKKGHFDEALAAFAELTKDFPDDIGIKADYIVVLTWANKNQEALDFAKSIDLNVAPTYCINALARAARDSGNYAQALKLYGQVKQREPSNLDPVLGMVLNHIDANEFDIANSDLSLLRQTYPNNIEVYRALSYFGQQTKQPVVVIDANTHILALNNKDKEAARSLIIAAREAGATTQAMMLVEMYPNAVDKNEVGKINNDAAALYIAWGLNSVKDPANRFADTDKALVKLDEACQCDWNTLDLHSDSKQNLAFDRIVALRNRYRMQDAINQYSQLGKANITAPSYVLSAVGDAYLYKHMPEEALKAYDASIAKDASNIETKFSKFYTLIELERFDDASKLLNSLSKDVPDYRSRPKNPVIRPNDAKFEVDSKSAYLLAYGDDLAGAEAKFQALNNIGPMNHDVDVALAEIERWRGWPEKTELRMSKTIQEYPDEILPKTLLANAHLDLREWRVAEAETQSLVRDYPENSTVQELNRRLQLHKSRQLTMDAFTSQSSGSTLGSRSKGLNAVLYSSPIDYNYRAFLSTQYAYANYPEGVGHAFFPGIGLEYTNRDWRLTGAVSEAIPNNNGITSTLTAEYRVNDYWSLASLVDINSSQMPLRGLRTGKSGDLINISSIYRWSDLTRASIVAGYMNMDDSNQREIINIAFDRRLITKPHNKLTTHLLVDTSHNKQVDVSYFNPASDLDTKIILDNEWMLWRRYERSFGHRLQIGAGQYWQKNFGTDSTWTVSYEQQFKWDDAFEIDYGIERSRHPYDGVNETATQFFARLNLLY
ncbi:poly-beta-1,6 N-acetyl-D-glucosamine export porin PgaA [Methylotenera sp.]|uniref:poly-beta-1,6 N-acetyl-D-glucosamine export porin PgaA n=1 Tax=Methylotenera sp. TaxID=2051956 RepID=UPI002489E490|nr:poly-beta-1,6 N-acetyl-D-glucosamine export porin PgaA [Methylotenera sp.]MDI1298493.1 poly-beta-1,6 N-acetyl-D-glucosamine export porin PgaA [Methylotenera sp.]